MNYQLVFRSPFGQVTAIVVGILCVVFLGLIWGSDGFLPMLQSAPLPIGLAYFSWWIWGWPSMILDGRGITVHNQLRSYHIGWDSLVKAESRFGLYLYVRTHEADGPVAEELHEPEGGEELTIGDVDPVNLDPDNLASAKSLYVSGVPARGGIRTAAGKQVPIVPTLDMTTRNRIVLRVSPSIAARIVDEEKFYLDNPLDRPGMRTSRESFPVTGSAFEGLTTSINYPQIAGLAAFVLYWAWMLL